MTLKKLVPSWLANPDDRGRVPAPVEDDSEFAWAEFDSCWQQLDQQVPATPKARAKPTGAQLRAADRDCADGLFTAPPAKR